MRRTTLTHLLIGLSAALGLMLSATVAAAAPADTQFSAMDTNQDGKLSPTEHALGAQKLFEAMDANHDGRVTAAEMDAAQAVVNPGQPVSKAVTSTSKIAVIDRNADGVISAEEHANGSREMFATMDTNRDGALTPAELRIGHERMLERTGR